MNEAAQSKSDGRGGQIATSVAGLAATGALACAVCCVLPFALPAAALAVSGSVLAWFSHLYRGATYAALFLVAVAWVWVLVQSWRTRKRPATTTVFAMLAATAMLALAFSWPFFEPGVIAKLGG